MNDSVFIVGGGPSLKNFDFNFLKGKDVIAVNKAVFGVPDPKWGEAVTAAVTLRSGTDTSERELIEFCKSKVAAYKSPKKVHIFDSLPKNAYGKILQRELKKRFSE